MDTGWYVVNWYVKALKQYVDFRGRARRTEYWMFTLFNVIISIVLGIIDRPPGGPGARELRTAVPERRGHPATDERALVPPGGVLERRAAGTVAVGALLTERHHREPGLGGRFGQGEALVDQGTVLRAGERRGTHEHAHRDGAGPAPRTVRPA